MTQYPSNLEITKPTTQQEESSPLLGENHITIPASLPLSPILAFDFLRKKGIEWAQVLAGDIWTDYNEHDPGVTILEQLCYALTDIGYRSNFTIEDLLYAKTKDHKGPENNAFFTPQDILPGAPISANDYRRLLIDRVPFVKNAWVDFQKTNIYGFEGLSQVKVQLWDDLEKSKRGETIEQVKVVLQEHRNLGQDFEEITILETERIGISAQIWINPGEIGEHVLSEMIHELENYLNPIVNFYSLEESLEAGWSINDCLTGPQPIHGLIREEELRPLTSEIHVSNLYEIMVKVPGVREVKNLIVRQDGKRVDDNVIVLAKDRHPILEEAIYRPLHHNSTIQIFRDNVEIPMDYGQIQQLLDIRIAKDRKGYNLKMKNQEYQSRTTKKLEEIEEYVSLQNYFPQVYGLSEFGLSPRATRKRKAQVNQLKGYLFFFEQILSNHLSQLANIRHLFSIEESMEKSYYAQFPFQVPGIDALIKGRSNGEVDEDLQDLVSEFDPFLDRRNRFLDHLLARFGEQYQNELWIKLNNVLDEDKDENDVKREMIRSKCQFLQNYVELSRNRGKGINYTAPAWENDNVSAFKKRICLQLNIANQQNKSFTASLNKARFASSLPRERQEEAAVENPPVRLSLQEMLYFGISRDQYTIEAEEESGLFQLKFQNKKGQEKLIFQDTQKKRCQEKLDKFLSLLQQVSNESEGFFVVENILLRPKLTKKWTLTLMDENQEKLLISSQMNSYENQQYLSEDLLGIGSEYSNYELIKTESSYYITLKNALNKTVMVSPGHFDLNTAYDRIKMIMKLLETTKREEPSRLSRLVTITEEAIDGLDDIYSNFYSHRLSLVLPSWPTRFQNEDFRDLFFQTVISNIPVHLAVDYYWLGFSEMKNFEKLYQLWLEEKAKPDAIDKKLDDLSFQLAEILLAYKEKKAGQIRPSKKEKAPLPFTGSYHLLSDENLQVIEGIGVKIEELLHANDISDWKTLAHATLDQLKDILIAGGPAFRIHSPHTWSDQAWLACKGDWPSLVTYQKFLNSREKDGKYIESPAKVDRILATIKPPQVIEENLQAIKGIGPRVEAVLKAAGIPTLHKLSTTTVPRLYEILEAAGIHKLATPDTWPDQAKELY